ncbi:MAG TPA: hypothetical protein PKJ74_07225 [Chitinophagales bacterium]|nr:hypothetical protein [Chitinophagales bacterium]
MENLDISKICNFDELVRLNYAPAINQAVKEIIIDYIHEFKSEDIRKMINEQELKMPSPSEIKAIMESSMHEVVKKIFVESSYEEMKTQIEEKL